MKKMSWKQLGNVEHKRILDFGSGVGLNANHYAQHNEVVAVEPDGNSIEKRVAVFPYVQMQGSVQALQALESGSFDMILCHNVLEYIPDHAPVLREFERLLKAGGVLSIVKHNRNGRIMQMVVLLNDFAHAAELLHGAEGRSAQYGNIHYYEDKELAEWENFSLENVYGIRTFWHLQQNQEIHRNEEWQQKMLQMEESVSQIEDFRDIAMFHHLILRKKRI